MLTHPSRIGQFGEFNFSSKAHRVLLYRSCSAYETRAQFRSAIAISAPQEKRSLGRLAMALSRTASTLGGIPARRCDTGAGSSFVIFVMSTAMFEALNGTSPTKSSYRVTPSENKSDNPVRSSAASCSGDIYMGVPSTMPVLVALLSVILATPKSLIFSEPSFGL